MTARFSTTQATRSPGPVYKNGAHSKSKLLYLFVPGGIVFSVLPGFCLPISYVSHPDTPHPAINAALFVLLLVGLLFTAIGYRMSAGQWKGVSEQLHARLALAGLAFTVITTMDILNGATLRLLPTGFLLAISAVFMLSRLLVRFVARNRYPWEGA